MTALPEGFVRFWVVYPRHTAKGAAIKAWEKINPDEEMVMRICHSLADQKNYRQKLEEKNSTLPERKQKFIPDWPHPSTWLNGARWDDEIPSTADVLLTEKPAQACTTPDCPEKGVALGENRKLVCSRCYTKLTHPHFAATMKETLKAMGFTRGKDEPWREASMRCIRDRGLINQVPRALLTEDDF